MGEPKLICPSRLLLGFALLGVVPNSAARSAEPVIMLSKEHDTVFRCFFGVSADYIQFRRDGTYRIVTISDVPWVSETDKGTWIQDAAGTVELRSTKADDHSHLPGWQPCFHISLVNYRGNTYLTSQDLADYGVHDSIDVRKWVDRHNSTETPCKFVYAMISGKDEYKRLLEWFEQTVEWWEQMQLEERRRSFIVVVLSVALLVLCAGGGFYWWLSARRRRLRGQQEVTAHSAHDTSECVGTPTRKLNADS